MANEGQDLTVSFLLEAKIRARSCNQTFRGAWRFGLLHHRKSLQNAG
jgi:hypothetical protein